MHEKDLSAIELEKRCAELEKQVEYYKNIAEKAGQKRLREVEQLNRLVSEHRKSENALRESEHRFRLIAQSTNDIFYELDMESGEFRWLGYIDNALGYEIGEIKHTLEGWLRLIHPEDRPLIDKAVLLRNESKKPIKNSYRVICKDGSVRYWYDSSSPVLDDRGKPKKWFGGISDITLQKQAEEALIHAQRLGAIGELASGVAHDFNNSLQGILGNIELALLTNTSPKERGYLEAIKKSSLDAASRIRQLNRFSVNSKVQHAYEQINVNEILDDVISQTMPLWKDECEKSGTRIEISKNYAETDLKVYANAGEIRSVLYNLIKNSVYAMPEGGRLTFKTREAENGVCITVTDSGIGMNEETKTKIFQPFFTTKGFDSGKGLGMSTSYAIVKEHGGDIYVKKSIPGKGTSIEIILPRSRRKNVRLENAVESKEGSARVLWVDDEEMIRHTGKALLENLKHSVDVAASGEEALSLLQYNQYDLMITDVGMPEMNGWKLAEIVKGKYPQMKIAVVTGWGADISNEKKYGVEYMLGKPVHIEQLKHLVSEVIKVKYK